MTLPALLLASTHQLSLVQTFFDDTFAGVHRLDLFDWSLNGIYGDVANGQFTSAGPVRRNLQMRFAKRLATMWTAPARGTPTDAQALARLTLQRIAAYAAAAQRRNLDDVSRAHAGALQALAQQAIDARATIAPPAPGQ